MSGGLAGVVGRQFTQSAARSAVQGDETGGGLAATIFESSAQKGGDFANGVIGTIARGNIKSMGTMKGAQASRALISYMGFAGIEDAPTYTNVEIGGGRISGIETSSENPEGIAFGMYNTDQYIPPDSSHTVEKAEDGTTWYKQYAADTAERTPYTASDGTVEYRETIVRKLPPIPRRKDRV
jgi:hypothetical protein